MLSRSLLPVSEEVSACQDASRPSSLSYIPRNPHLFPNQPWSAAWLWWSHLSFRLPVGSHTVYFLPFSAFPVQTECESLGYPQIVSSGLRHAEVSSRRTRSMANHILALKASSSGKQHFYPHVMGQRMLWPWPCWMGNRSPSHVPHRRAGTLDSIMNDCKSQNWVPSKFAFTFVPHFGFCPVPSYVYAQASISILLHLHLIVEDCNWNWYFIYKKLVFSFLFIHLSA